MHFTGSFKLGGSPSTQMNSLILNGVYVRQYYKVGPTGPDNGLSPIRRQAVIWTNASLSSTGPPRAEVILSEFAPVNAVYWKWKPRE